MEWCVCVCVYLIISGWRSPGNCRHPSAVLVDEVTASVEHPAVVEGHEGVSSRGGGVLSVLSVSILQRGELVFAQHLVYDKGPFGHIRKHVRPHSDEQSQHTRLSFKSKKKKDCFVKLKSSEN